MVEEQIIIEDEKCKFIVDKDQNLLIRCEGKEEIGLGKSDVLLFKKVVEIMEED